MSVQNVASEGIMATVAETLETPGTRLKAQRERLRLRQDDVAARAGISPRTLQYMERGDDGRRNMHRSVEAVREALAALATHPPAADSPTSPRRLRAVEAHLLDTEDVVEVVTRETRPGVRVMTVVLVDSDHELTDEDRADVQRMAERSRPDVTI